MNLTEDVVDEAFSDMLRQTIALRVTLLDGGTRAAPLVLETWCSPWRSNEVEADSIIIVSSVFAMDKKIRGTL